MANENRFSNLMGGLGNEDEKAESKPKKPAKKPSKKSSTTVSTDSSIAKHRSENYAQVGMYLPKELHRKMKIAAAMTGEEMSAIAAQGIELWLKENTPDI